MSYILFILNSALEDFKRNKVRTLLTSLGILIGVASVVLLMAFGLGLKKSIQNQFESMGTNLIYILPGGMFQNGGFNADSTADSSYDEKDVAALSRLDDVNLVAPIFQRNTSVSAGTETKLTPVMLISAETFKALNLEAEYGSLFTNTDVAKRAKLAVLAPKIAEDLFKDKESAVGKNVSVGKLNFKVGGVLKAKGAGGFGGPQLDSYVYVPFKSAASLNPNKKFLAIYVQAADSDKISSVKADVETVLLKRYDKDNFSIIEATDFLNAINSIFGIMNTVLVAIAAISLIVGGIGIMNIMYVSVVERIREIGIRRSVGATKRDILVQFLSEAIILSVMGGLLGLTLAYIIVLITQKFFPAYIDLQSILLSLGVSGSIGILFGVFPARKAANLSPIEAIRYE